MLDERSLWSNDASLPACVHGSFVVRGTTSSHADEADLSEVARLDPKSDRGSHASPLRTKRFSFVALSLSFKVKFHL